MSASDVLFWLPFGAITLALAGLVVSLRSAIVRRDLRKARLELHLGLGRAAGYNRKLPWRLRRMRVAALFIIVPQQQQKTFEVPLILNLQNRSKKTVKDVMLEISLPKRLLVSNSEIKRMTEQSFKLLQEEGITDPLGDNDDQLNKLVEKRELTVDQTGAQVRYHVGLLRPGEGWVLCEPIRISVPASRDKFSGVHSLAYARIASLIRGQEDVFEQFVIRYSVFADNYAARHYRGSVCVFKPSSNDKLRELAIAYVRAHWFGRAPLAGSYFVPQFPLNLIFGRRRRRGPEVAEFMRLGVEVVKGKPKNNRITIATRFDPAKSEVGYVELHLPPYDPFELPDDVQTPEEALNTIGAARVLRRREVLRRYARRRLRRLSSVARAGASAAKTKIIQRALGVRRRLGI